MVCIFGGAVVVWVCVAIVPLDMMPRSVASGRVTVCSLVNTWDNASVAIDFGRFVGVLERMKREPTKLWKQTYIFSIGKVMSCSFVN